MKHALLLTALSLPLCHAGTSLTIYNRNLAVVREDIPLDLKAGVTPVNFDRATARVQPDSVVLRDPSGEAAFSILEQSYRNDPVSESLLLDHFEGQTIDFRYEYYDGKIEMIQGRIVRSGHNPGGSSQDPIIEVGGKLRFDLPGDPFFPALGDDSILKPTLVWDIHSKEAAQFDAQLSYLSEGFNWEADYNFVTPEKGETATMTGWVTVSNRSGTTFKDSKVKLVAGDVNIMDASSDSDPFAEPRAMLAESAKQVVTEKAFDDFHLYTLPRPLTVRDKETKQVEFIRAPKVTASKSYVYDPAKMLRFHGGRNTNPIQGREFPKDVAIFWEFTNDEESGLGMPLPAGRVRFYRTDNDDGNLEFVGENNIDHTPRNEEVSLYTGNAFDLVGERKITDFKRNDREKWMRESVEVTVKNRSKEAKTITVREHLWRWSNWNIENASMKFEKKDSNTIEFEVPLQADEEKTITFTTYYSW